jgi:hypothetical protein
MTTDINRLHRVILGDYTGIQCGHTYAKCHELAGVLETTCNKNVLCIISSMADIEDYLLGMIIGIFSEHNFYPNSDCNNSYIYNKSEHCLWVSVKGLYEKRLVKFTDMADMADILINGYEGYYVDFTDGEIR